MRILSNARRLARVLKPPAILLDSHHPLLSSYSSLQGEHRHNASSGMRQGGYLQMPQHPIYLMMSRKSFSSEAGTVTGNPTEGVKELFDKMLESVNVKRTMPPNAWLWSLLESCKNHEDIELLFDILRNLRRFRLSNLRIHENFNCNLCREVTKTCVRVGALNFGKKALWKHNVYGLTPTVGSAHHLLSYAKDHNDVKLMVEVMDLLKRITYHYNRGQRILFSDNWELISKYAKRFVVAEAKLRKTSFDTWMKFAAKRGDTESLWRIEKLRSETVKQHSVSSGFSCAKSSERAAIDGGRIAHVQGTLPPSMGFLLERKPQDAADIIQLLDQTLPGSKKLAITDELEKLVNEWPFEVIKHQKEEDRKALAASIKSDIPAMVCLLSAGSAVRVNLEDLDKNEILC